MSDSTAIIVTSIMGGLITIALALIRFLWAQGEANKAEMKAEIKEMKDDLKDEIIRLRDKVHELAPIGQQLDNFVKFMRDRNA